MLDILPTISAILMIVVLGHVIKRTNLLDISIWDLMSRLCYWVLFPCLLFNLTSTAVLSSDFLAPFLTALSLASVGVVAFAYAAAKFTRQGGPAVASLIQGSLRHNGFLALSILQGVAGITALQIGGIGVAFLVPISNIVAVIVHFMLREGPAEANMSAAITKEVARNPLIGSVLLGGLVNVLGVPVPLFVSQGFDMLGNAALPLLLLCIGASLHIAGFRGHIKPLVMASIAKVIVFPGLLVGCGLYFDVGATALLVLAAIGASPTASSSFALAKELGGDADLMAEIISLQTLIAAISMPAWIVVAQYLAQTL